MLILLLSLLIPPGDTKLDTSIKTAPDICGLWSVKCADYKGYCYVTKTKHTYLFQYCLGIEGGAYTGIGIYDEDKKVLAVNWKTSKMEGVTLYTVQQNTLKGYFISNPGDGQKHREDLERVKE